MHRISLVATLAVACALARGAAAAPDVAGGGLCAAIATQEGNAHVAVLSAFPAELEPLVARAVVREQVEVDGRTFYVGELAGVRVVLGLLGIGMVNAATNTESLFPRFDLVGLMVSGVAGSPRQIGDVTVPVKWLAEDTGGVFAANPALLQLARRIARGLELERCTPVPPPSGSTVCVPNPARLAVGGRGHSGDPFGGIAFPCLPGGGPVFGCELPATSASAPAARAPAEPIAEDMETGAVARVATGHGVPWVAFRGVSDGAGDPLGLPGFPDQFFAYYPLAARNTAAGAAAVLDALAQLGDGRRAHRSLCRLLAKGRWARAARRLRRSRG